VGAVLYSSIRPAGASPTPLTGVRRIGERFRPRKKAADVARQSAPWIVPNDKSEPLTGGSVTTRRLNSALWRVPGPLVQRRAGGAYIAPHLLHCKHSANRESTLLNGMLIPNSDQFHR
jgi:hypothetical protein